MKKSFTSNADGDSSRPPALHIPTEIYENVIDMLYSMHTRDTLQNIATLSRCALVCRAWRVRSQRMLFYKIQLSAGSSFHRLVAILDAGQHLRKYVHEVILAEHYPHATTSIFALFPAVFAGKLPNLRSIDVILRLRSAETDETSISYPSRPDPPKFKALQHIPLHLHFPAFLSSFTAVSSMCLDGTTFRSFTEFARMLRGLPSLEDLGCHSVRWITPGGTQSPDPDFTKQPDWADERCVRPPFAPKLRWLHLIDMAQYGVERLIRTRGPYLTRLEVSIPLYLGVEEQDNGVEKY
ncbi:hypothetical protein V8D89_001275 [Ganoderma adspersum]